MMQTDLDKENAPAVSAWVLRHPALTILLLFLFSVGVRLATAEYIDIGGDNATRWVDALRLVKGMGLTGWSHHNMRWTIIVPLWGLMKLFGTNPVLYYVIPILVSSVGTIFLFLIGKRLHSVGLGLCAALLTILFPQMAETGSQLWPSVFQFTFAAASCWAILAWHESGNRAQLIFASLCFFCAWGARTSAVYFFPGLVAMVWWPRKDYRAAFLFCLLVGACIAGEWLFFWLDSGNPWGRIGLIKVAAVRDVETISMKDYLLNPLKLTKLRGLMPIFILSAIATVSLLRSRDRRLGAFAFFHLVFLFLFLYMVSGLSPIRLAQPIGTRYWCAGAPFGLTIILIWLFNIKGTWPKTGLTLIVILFLAFTAFTVKKIPDRNALVQTARDNEILRPVMDQKRPFLLHWTFWSPNLIESGLFKALGINAKRGKRPDHVLAAMRRGAHRALGMYSSNPENFRLFEKGTLVPVSEMSYKFIPYGTPEDAPVAATIFFERRTAHAAPGEKWPESEKE